MKKGKYNQKPLASFNSDVLVVKKPGLFKLPDLSSSDYIDLEKYLFGLGAFDANINDPFSL